MITFFYKNKKGDELEVEKYEDVDESQLDAFIVKHNNQPLLTILFDDARKRLVWAKTSDCYLVGWQMNVGSESIKNINHIYEDQNKVWLEQKGI